MTFYMSLNWILFSWCIGNNVSVLRIKLKSNYKETNLHPAVPNRELTLSFWKTVGFEGDKAVLSHVKSSLLFSKYCVTTQIREYSKNTLFLYLFDFQWIMFCIFSRIALQTEVKSDSHCPREKENQLKRA